MMQQAQDFLSESEALYSLVTSLSEQDFERKTAFKDWTINTVIRHLHLWNWAADLALKDTDAFQAFLVELRSGRGSLNEFEKEWVDGLSGQALVQTWRGFFSEMTARFDVADPARRVAWAGPDMSVRMAATARQMETWAHGQDVFDMLRRPRAPTDRLKNIAVLGVKTFGWTFTNRGMAVPADMPHVTLAAPSGATWNFSGADGATGRIEGSAMAFCHVVTQGRNIADTALTVTGDTARQWMAIAQCFAGPPRNPPAPGERTH